MRSFLQSLWHIHQKFRQCSLWEASKHLWNWRIAVVNVYSVPGAVLGLFIHSLSSRNSPGRHILSPLLYGLRNKDSERLADPPQVSTNAHNRLSRDLRPDLPGPKAPCSFHWTELSLLHFSTHLGLIMWTRTWQTWAYFQLPALHLIPTCTHPRRAACLFLQFTKRVGKGMTRELISAKQMEPPGEKGSVWEPRNKWGNLRIWWCIRRKFHENQSRKSPVRVY